MDFSDSTITKVAAGASVVTFLAVSYSKWRENRIPTKWIQVGEVSELYFFPLKSCGKMSAQEVECTKLGIKQEFLWDRTFMIVQESGKRFVTARQYPSLVRVMPSMETEGVLRLSAPNMEDIKIRIKEVLAEKKALNPEMWEKIPVGVFDCGDDVAKWISQYVLKEDTGLRVVYYPHDHPTRPVLKANIARFPEASPDHTGALHDEASYMMINEASVDDLNTRLDFKVSPLTFRPNILFKGPKAFDEDKYKWVKIGNDTILRVTQPCLRCAFTNIDPETGERRVDGQPLKTLKEYRKFKQWGDSPAMGIHLGMIKSGKIKVGDAIFVQSH